MFNEEYMLSDIIFCHFIFNSDSSKAIALFLKKEIKVSLKKLNMAVATSFQDGSPRIPASGT